MRKCFVILGVTIGLVLMAAGSAAAQDSSMQTSTNDTASNSHSNVRTVTGCLRRGEGSGEYELLGQNGSTWELHSDAVNLASHVGHTVTITGAVANSAMHNMKEDAKREAADAGASTSPEHGHLTVTDLTMVSDSCK